MFHPFATLPVRLMVLQGCGAVWDTAGGPVLFIPSCGCGPFTTLCPWLLSVLVLAPCSVALLLTVAEDAPAAVLLDVWLLFAFPPSGLRVVDLSVAGPADLTALGGTVPGLAISLTDATVLEDKLDVDLSPLDAGFLLWLFKVGLVLDLFSS